MLIDYNFACMYLNPSHIENSIIGLIFRNVCLFYLKARIMKEKTEILYLVVHFPNGCYG